MDSDLEKWIIFLKKIDMKNYHKMIKIYGEETVNNKISLLIKKNISNEITDEELLVLWEKYGYYFAIYDENEFLEKFIQKFKVLNNRQIHYKNISDDKLFSVDEEIYYGFHLLKRAYIQIFDEKNDGISLNLCKIFKSIHTIEEANYLIHSFEVFYQKYQRVSNFDTHLKNILLKYRIGISNGKLLSCEELGISETSTVSLLPFDELQEQIKMYLSYSEAFYQFQIHNFRLVESFVEKKFGHWNEEDLIQAGILGLNEAIKKFDIRKGVYFSSYAYFLIQKYVLDCAYLDFNSFSSTRYDIVLQNKAMRIANDYKAETGENISNEELAIRLGKKDLKKLPFFYDRSNIVGQSLEGYYDASSDNDSISDNGLSLLEVLEDKNINIENKAIFQYDFLLLLKYMDDTLSEREKDVLFKRAGYQIEKPMTLREIACAYGVTTEAIRLVEKKAIHKLTRTKKGNSFNPYC